MIKLPKPIQCHLWREKMEENVLENDFDFEPVDDFKNSEDPSRVTLKCGRCGQIYFYESMKDTNCEIYIPVFSAKHGLELNSKSSQELLNCIPRLESIDDKPFHWVGVGLI